MSEAFISYSRADSAFVDKLTRELEKRGVSVWIDREDIEGGAAWRASISQAIRSCCAFILILSPRSTQSNQVSKELSVAETHNRLIIPVVVEACDIPPGMELQLAELQWISFAEHPYDAAVERLTRVINEARARVEGASRSGAQDAAQPASIVRSRPAKPEVASSQRAPANAGTNRKWLLAGTAAIVVAGASVAAFQFAQKPGANEPIQNAARNDAKAPPAEPAPIVPAAVPVVATAPEPKGTVNPGVSQASRESTVARAATPVSSASGSERGGTRSEAQQRTVPASAEKPVVVARVDPVPEKPAVVVRADPAPAKPSTDVGSGQSSGPIVGNTRTKFYHYPGCPNYLTIASQARIEFSSAREAEGAGYKLSVNCADPSGGRAAAAVVANSRTKEYFLPHCRGYAATGGNLRVPFNSATEAEQAGYRRSDNCS
jgi:hypothetical protein